MKTVIAIPGPFSFLGVALLGPATVEVEQEMEEVVWSDAYLSRVDYVYRKLPVVVVRGDFCDVLQFRPGRLIATKFVSCPLVRVGDVLTNDFATILREIQPPQSLELVAIGSLLQWQLPDWLTKFQKARIGQQSFRLFQTGVESDVPLVVEVKQ